MSFYSFFCYYSIVIIEWRVLIMERLLKSRVFRVITIILLIVLLLLLGVFLFLKLWVPLGGSVTYADRINYLERASNYKNDKFSNENLFLISFPPEINISLILMIFYCCYYILIFLFIVGGILFFTVISI